MESDGFNMVASNKLVCAVIVDCVCTASEKLVTRGGNSLGRGKPTRSNQRWVVVPADFVGAHSWFRARKIDLWFQMALSQLSVGLRCLVVAMTVSTAKKQLYSLMVVPL